MGWDFGYRIPDAEAEAKKGRARGFASRIGPLDRPRLMLLRVESPDSPFWGGAFCVPSRRGAVS